MAEAQRIITASELEQMSPQERADAVRAGRVASSLLQPAVTSATLVRAVTT